MKKQNTIIMILLLVGILLVSGCIREYAERPKEEYFIDELIITFNSETNNNLTASINSENEEKNIDFKNYFVNEITVLNKTYKGITSIDSRFSKLSNLAFIKINYDQTFSLEEKKALLKNIKTELETKWYIKKVDFSWIEHVQNNK